MIGFMNSLLEAVRRFTDSHSTRSGIAPTSIEGLYTVRASTPSSLVHDISKPLVCLVVQGSKRVMMGMRQFDFSAGDSMLITSDVPTVSQITKASVAAPYYSIVMELDRALIAELALEINVVLVSDHAPIRVEPTDQEVADAALRLLRLVDRPSSIGILKSQLVREVHYWLLAGRHGEAIRRIATPGGYVERVAHAVAILRSEYAKAVPVERLAEATGMGVSSFHHHFRDVTSLTPHQFQKHLRLIEARRLMMSDGLSASSAAFAVGYASVPQFTREYGRHFGQPPVRDAKSAAADAA
jgi:AraC-like DNA-binding protein